MAFRCAKQRPDQDELTIDIRVGLTFTFTCRQADMANISLSDAFS
jgi:hypothetical protein